MNKPFDLKAALSGEPVQYRGLCTCEFLKLSRWEGKPCIQFSRVGERTEHLTSDLDGKVMFCSDDGDKQLTMAPRKVKKKVWVNVYRSEVAQNMYVSCPHLTVDEADRKGEGRIGVISGEIEVDE